MDQSSYDRDFRLAACAYLVSWALLAAPWLTGQVTIPYDAKAHFHAQIQFLANALHSGQSPFWAPHVFAGTPQIADPQSLIFSPAFLLAYFDPSPSFRSVDAYILGLLGLGGFAVLYMFRERCWHPAAGAVAALAFAFGGSAAWRIQHIGQVQSYALFGIALFLLDRALRRRSARWGAAAGIATGLMLMEPNQVAMLGCYVLAMIVAAHWLTGEGVVRTFRQTLLPLLSAGAVAIVIAGLPLLMTYLFVATSSRPGIALDEAMRGSLHPASLLTVFVSDLFGAFDPKVDYWGPFSSEWDPNELTLTQNMGQLYMGALPAVLIASFGLIRGRLWAREACVFSLATIALILYALGRHTPAFPAFHDLLPGVSLFRRPADATFMIGALLAILAGYVLHRKLTDPAPPARPPALNMAALPALGVALAVGIAIAMAKLSLAWRPAIMSVLWLAVSFAAVRMIAARRRLNPLLAATAPVLLLAADIAANNGPNESTGLPPAQYRILSPDGGNETIATLKMLLAQPPGSPRRDRVELAGLGFDWPNASLVHGIDHVLGYNPLRLDVVTRAIGARDTIAGPDQRHFTPLFPSYRSTLANLLGLRFIASSIPVEEIDHLLVPGALPLVARTPDAYIYENRQALPRAMLVHKWRLADFEAVVRTGDWPADPAMTVLLETKPAARPRVLPAVIGGGPAMDRVRITKYENTVVEIETETDTPGFLVLNDVWHPWWTAQIGGRETPILKANVMFRAVEVPAGRHTLRFEFEPLRKAMEQIADRAPTTLGSPSPIRTVGDKP